MAVEPTVAEYMSPSPLTIGADQSAREALRRMQGHHIHHLPVLHGGELVGMVSERDAYFVLEISSDVDQILVEDVMSSEPYCVRGDEPLADVVRHMARHRIGSAVVTQGQRVEGVLTSTDALYALVDQLRAGSEAGAAGREHREAQLRLARSARVRHLIATTDRAAAELVTGTATRTVQDAFITRRLPRLCRVLELESEHGVEVVDEELALLKRQQQRLDTEPHAATSVATEVHAALSRLRNRLASAEQASAH